VVFHVLTKEPNLLRSLQYFDAVYRHRSVKQAAESLGVTQSAVSHQLRRFLEVTGQHLLVKSGRGIVLTPTGEALGARITEAFCELEYLVSDIAGGGRQTLQLAVCSSFGPGWLIDRLDSFYEAYPDVELELRLFARNPLLTNEVADVYIVADELKPGFAAIPLMDEMLNAVEAPPARAEPHDRRRRLITTDVEKGRIGEDWIDYCNSFGIKLESLQQGPFRLCSHYFLALELARRGYGTALVPDFLAARDIRSKTLVPVNDRLFPSGRTYHICFKTGRSSEKEIKQFVDWLLSTAPESATRAGNAVASARGRRRPPTSGREKRTPGMSTKMGTKA
jgi:LysR family glycine cleavage system transcriptional activator